MRLFSDDKPEKQTDMQVFSIYDSITQSYRLPGYAVNIYDLQRQFEQMMRDPKQQQADIFTSPQDFTVFRIGDFDRKTGLFNFTKTAEPVLRMHEFVAQIIQRAKEAQPISLDQKPSGH